MNRGPKLRQNQSSRDDVRSAAKLRCRCLSQIFSVTTQADTRKQKNQCDQTWPFPATVAVFGVWVAGKIWWWPVAGVAGYYVVLNNQKKF